MEHRRVAVVTSASPGTGGPAARQLAAAGSPVSGASRTAPARGSAIERVVIDVRGDSPAARAPPGSRPAAQHPSPATVMRMLRDHDEKAVMAAAV